VLLVIKLYRVNPPDVLSLSGQSLQMQNRTKLKSLVVWHLQGIDTANKCVYLKLPCCCVNILTDGYAKLLQMVTLLALVHCTCH